MAKNIIRESYILDLEFTLGSITAHRISIISFSPNLGSSDNLVKAIKVTVKFIELSEREI